MAILTIRNGVHLGNIGLNQCTDQGTVYLKL